MTTAGATAERAGAGGRLAREKTAPSSQASTAQPSPTTASTVSVWLASCMARSNSSTAFPMAASISPFAHKPSL